MKTRRLLPIACVLSALVAAFAGEPTGALEPLPPPASRAAPPPSPDANAVPELMKSSTTPRKVVKVVWT